LNIHLFPNPNVVYLFVLVDGMLYNLSFLINLQWLINFKKAISFTKRILLLWWWIIARRIKNF